MFEFDIGVNSMHEPQALRLIHLKGVEPLQNPGRYRAGLGARHEEFAIRRLLTTASNDFPHPDEVAHYAGQDKQQTKN
jgi:hypothetical protein